MFIFNILFVTLLPFAYPSDAELDSLLAIQRERAGMRVHEFFDPLDQGLMTNQESADYRFLLAYLPLGDLAEMKGEDLLENVRLAQTARNGFSWSEDIPEDIYLHFVLPHRVSQEPFVSGWRDQFMQEISARVEGLSMSEAALEVNHWCHEKATFKVSSPRDQDPLTTIRAGLGRCEEEMILTICALRSVGIPARQCYTPYWAHTDNNHAWVEFWADGGWHYLGGCEPKPAVDDAWFTEAAGRAMLVVSTAYGDYHGDEPVLKRYPGSTLINSTAVYGPTRTLKVLLRDPNSNPVPDTRIVFSLFNYGALMPALALDTDTNGCCEVVCGRGSWIAGATKDKWQALRHIPGEVDECGLGLAKAKLIRDLTEFEYAPPPKREDVVKPELDSLFKARLTFEDSLRDSNVWSVWIEETGMGYLIDEGIRPDSTFVDSIASKFSLNDDKLLEILTNARGNWGMIYFFLTGDFPAIDRDRWMSDFEVKRRFYLLETLAEKDLHDFSIEVLLDHFSNTTMDWCLFSDPSDFDNGLLDSLLADELVKECVVAPRINYEPSLPWRAQLIYFLEGNPELVDSKRDKKLIQWIRDSIAVEEESDRLGPPLTPGDVLTLRRGRPGDIERLYVGLCRVRGIPARFDPVSDRLEVWQGKVAGHLSERHAVTGKDVWLGIQVLEQKKGEKKPPKNGQLTVLFDAPDSIKQQTLYMRDWAVQQWFDDHGSPVDFGYQKAFNEISFPQELPAGTYCLTTGRRRDDGSASVNMQWFEVKSGKRHTVEMVFLDMDDLEVEMESGEEPVPGEEDRQEH